MLCCMASVQQMNLLFAMAATFDTLLFSFQVGFGVCCIYSFLSYQFVCMGQYRDAYVVVKLYNSI